MSATLLESLTSAPTSRKPAQLAGCAKCLVVCTVCCASDNARDTRAPWEGRGKWSKHKSSDRLIKTLTAPFKTLMDYNLPYDLYYNIELDLVSNYLYSVGCVPAAATSRRS